MHVLSMKMLVGTNSLSSNQVAETKCIKACIQGQEDLLELKLSVEMGWRRDFSDFEPGTVVWCQQAVNRDQHNLTHWTYKHETFPKILPADFSGNVLVVSQFGLLCTLVTLK